MRSHALSLPRQLLYPLGVAVALTCVAPGVSARGPLVGGNIAPSPSCDTSQHCDDASAAPARARTSAGLLRPRSRARRLGSGLLIGSGVAGALATTTAIVLVTRGYSYNESGIGRGMTFGLHLGLNVASFGLAAGGGYWRGFADGEVDRRRNHKPFIAAGASLLVVGVIFSVGLRIYGSLLNLGHEDNFTSDRDHPYPEYSSIVAQPGAWITGLGAGLLGYGVGHRRSKRASAGRPSVSLQIGPQLTGLSLSGRF